MKDQLPVSTFSVSAEIFTHKMKHCHVFIMFLIFAIFELTYLLSQEAFTLVDMGIWNLEDQGTGERDGSDSDLHDGQGVDRGTSDSAVRSHLAVVACGKAQEGALMMLKSAVLFSKKPLQFHIFAEDNQHESIRNTLNSWPREVQNKFKFTTHSSTYPEGYDNIWKGLFKPCATLRLFLPIILREVDSLVYVDADTIFLQPVEDLWAFFSQFNSRQLVAMATEREDISSWYPRAARHPYYGKYGLNSGVMLMNMTRIRETSFKNDITTATMKWNDILSPIYQKYKDIVPWVDQDILNIIFNQNPEYLYQLPCSWNYRSDFCISKNCQHAERQGVSLLHGSRNCFHNNTQPAFRAVYDAIQKYQFGDNMVTTFLQPLEEALKTTTHTHCGKYRHLFTKKLRQLILPDQQ